MAPAYYVGGLALLGMALSFVPVTLLQDEPAEI
jgi:hypothetical protein